MLVVVEALVLAIAGTHRLEADMSLTRLNELRASLVGRRIDSTDRRRLISRSCRLVQLLSSSSVTISVRRALGTALSSSNHPSARPRMTPMRADTTISERSWA